MYKTIKFLTVLTFCIMLCCSSVLGQSTQVEKDAASKTLKAIKSFRDANQPFDLAAKIAGSKDEDRNAVVIRAAELWDTKMQDLSDWIGHHPEIGFEEDQAVEKLTAVLGKYGFKLEVGVAGLETAFVGRFDSPAGTDGPHLGVIVEYDALRGSGGEAYHGDQHNAQSPTGFAAAIAIKEYMEKNSIPGQIYVYGTPAEEMGPPSKAIMYKKGVFDDADFIIRSHGGQKWSRSRAGFGSCCLSINMVRYIFEGKISHQLSSHMGRNALKGAVMLYTAVDRLRTSWRRAADVQGIIPVGGTAPNNVPDSAVVDYYIRFPDKVYLDHITEMMNNAARGSAMATGTKVTIEQYGRYTSGISVSTLEELVFAYDKKFATDSAKVNYTLGRPTGYEETGMVSRNIPGVGVGLASSTASNHSLGMLKDTFAAIGHHGFKVGAKVMAAVLYDLLTNADFRELAKKEHQMLKQGYDSYIENLKAAYDTEMNIQLDN